MPKTGVTKIYFDNLEFKFYHKEHELIVVDHAYKKSYQLIPEHQPELPFIIILKEYVE